MPIAIPASNPSSSATDIAAIPGLRDLWAETLGDPRICVAILDGPVDLSHPSLSGAKLTQFETLASSAVFGGPAAEHGTHVASVIFGCHNGLVTGIAPQCRGLIAPIFTDVVNGSPVPCSQVDLARALLQAIQAGANIINVSGGQFSPTGTAHPILADAVQACARGGALIVAAAGNQGCECLHIPGALPSVLAVGAMDTHGEPLPSSNWGSIYRSQGILAPGENILGAVPGGSTSARSGTSFATPIVAGVVALLLSLQLRLGRKLDASAVKYALLRSALGCESQLTAECRRLLAGRLNVRVAASMVSSGGLSMTDSAASLESRAVVTELESALMGHAILPASGPASPTTAEIVKSVSLPAPIARPSNDRPLVESPGLSDGLIAPSACGCGGGGPPPQLVYALGQLGYDFGTEARRDAFIQNMDEPSAGVTPNPYDVNQLLNYLQSNPWEAASLIWTLSLDGTVIYAVVAQGPFATEVYQRLRQFLREQLEEGVERVSVPGTMFGKVRLLNGQVVPLIVPEIRGMSSWTTTALITAVMGGPLPDSASAEEKMARVGRENDLHEFLARVYFELRNLGITPQERAINFAGTNAFNIENIYESAAKEDMDLDSIEVDRSPICRPESDCWDVKLFFFFPDRQVQTVRKVYRFTVDVSDVVPVTVGPVRSWFMR